jgi:hypothetical protein
MSQLQKDASHLLQKKMIVFTATFKLLGAEIRQA